MFDQNEKIFFFFLNSWKQVQVQSVQVLIAGGMLFMGYLKHVYVRDLVIQSRENIQCLLITEIQVQAYPICSERDMEKKIV